MKVTLTVPDDLASELQSLDEDEMSRLLQLGLRRQNGASPEEFEGLTDVLETLAELPSPEEVLALRPCETLQHRVEELLEKNRTTSLSADEERWWQRYEFIEHLVRIAKAKAALKLKKD